ncbi:V4R domain-containing protein [Tannockella kyphosi]|uniref:V4R domain-containing protein n=1 Tax=Tannockella kyphosi TaxID=2899121 RepID=UPI002011230B|nr:V4R domain-containing protein [Tannockella kyphosi]
MLEFLKSEEDNRFSWDSIGSIEEGRTNLGESMPVYVYRLFQFTIKDVLIEKYGKENAIDVFRKSGDLAGREFAKHMLNLDLPFNEFISQLQETLVESKIGVLRVEKFDVETGFAVLTIGEDLDCSGLPITGETVCNYDEGFLAGVLKEYTKKEYVVTEVDCWASGARVCRFEAKVVE